MVEYGWRMFYWYNLRGCDVNISSHKQKFWMHCGSLYDDSLQYFTYYKNKLRRKLRVLHSRKKIPWDGYYYTNLSKEEYDSIIKKKGRPKKYYTFNNKISFKIFYEARIFFQGPQYIIKYKYPVDLGYTFEKDVLKCQEVEVIHVQDKSNTFKDILINENKYKLI
jgi:hypothetical protein